MCAACTCSQASSAPLKALSNPLATSANIFGSAPWNEKIDCLSSPTANNVRCDAARAGAGGEFVGQRADDLPLPRARILRFVDQDVIDAEIELVEHPGRGGVAEQRQRLVDQIVIVEQAAPVLLQPVARDDGVSDGEQGARPVAAEDGAPPFEQGADAGLLLAQPFGQCRMRFLRSPL